MNLLDEPWMPVRHHDGSCHWVAPPQLGDPRIAAFDACRPDFNGALAQFAIGLLQSCNDLASEGEWRALLKAPPSAERLRAWFEPVREAFEFEGDGARFMQDFELREADGEPTPIAALLIDTPGENTVKNNSDHFVKRGRVQAVCSHCAALALFTLQLNAPSGGAGHRTGLRGGGPLTTLLMISGDEAGLWTSLWLNVLPRSNWLDSGVEPGKEALRCRFPWLAPQVAQQPEGGHTAPVQTHPDQVFWAMPRRIRLLKSEGQHGECDLCQRPSEGRFSAYVTRNHGLNYKGAWRHPLSPYYHHTKEGWLPLHPHPDGLGYRHWAGWVLGFASEKRRIEPARNLARGWTHLERQLRQPLRLWAFGFDMDNMKARCWYDSTLPLYHLADLPLSAHQELQQDISGWVDAAEQAARYLRWAVRDAWFSHDSPGDLTHVEAAFWAATEPMFYKLLGAVLGGETSPDEDAERAARQTRAEDWLGTLQQQARRLFDEELVGSGRIDRQNPARVAAAHEQLRRNLLGDALRKMLSLPVQSADERASKKKPKTSRQAAAPQQENA